MLFHILLFLGSVGYAAFTVDPLQIGNIRHIHTYMHNTLSLYVTVIHITGYITCNFFISSNLPILFVFVFAENEELPHTEAIGDLETFQNRTRTNFEHLERLRNRSTYVARSCKEIRDRYGDEEGKEMFVYAVVWQ